MAHTRFTLQDGQRLNLFTLLLCKHSSLWKVVVTQGSPLGTRGPQFDSIHRPMLLSQLFKVTCRKGKEKNIGGWKRPNAIRIVLH